jgi:cell wall-associated NlpC family hydrolase
LASIDNKVKAGAAAVAAVLALAFAPAAATAGCASSGGLSADSSRCAAPAGAKAKLVDGMAIAPRSAPARVKAVIAAANRIRNKPYIYGGGHGRWEDRGYDCSGSVSYALHGGNFLTSPLDSTSFMRWEKGGRGRWITVYANSGHAYAVIAGLRWDTSMTPGDGPGWSEQMRSGAGYVVRHPAGY